MGAKPSLSLDHMNFSAVFEELHLIHQLVDQENSTTVIGIDAFASHRVGDARGIKSIPRVADHD